MVLGYGDSIAYDALVERVTGHRPDKTHRFTDWSRRPLTNDQLEYAVADVTHLRDVFAALDADLSYHDPYVPELTELGLRSVDLDAALAEADLVAVVTAHKEVDYAAVAAAAPLLIDFRVATRDINAANLVRL